MLMIVERKDAGGEKVKMMVVIGEARTMERVMMNVRRENSGREDTIGHTHCVYHCLDRKKDTFVRSTLCHSSG